MSTKTKEFFANGTTVTMVESYTWQVTPYWDTWVHNQLNSLGVTLEMFIYNFIAFNGVVKGIRMVRDIFGMDLRSAKDFVDEHFHQAKESFWLSTDYDKIQEDWVRNQPA